MTQTFKGRVNEIEYIKFLKSHVHTLALVSNKDSMNQEKLRIVSLKCSEAMRISVMLLQNTR